MKVNTTPENHYKVFWQIANMALEKRIVSREQIRTIARIGHRKEPYWGRHIHDLVWFLAYKGMPEDLKKVISDAGIEVNDGDIKSLGVGPRPDVGRDHSDQVLRVAETPASSRAEMADARGTDVRPPRVLDQ